MTIKSFLTASLFATALLPEATAFNPRPYCHSFWGQLTARVDVPDAVPKKNFDGKECPSRFWFDSWLDSLGGILHICPPDDSDNVPKGARLKASMFLGGGPNQSVPDPSVLWLQDLYITGGDVPDSDRGDLPALEVGDPVYKGGPTRWTVNGTQSALVDSKESNSSASLNCREVYSIKGLPEKRDSRGPSGTNNGYCGTSKDVKSKDGCWGQQSFELNSQTPLNFSIEFDRSEVKMKFSITGEYMEANKTASGTNTTVTYTFNAQHQSYSRDTFFWDHSYVSYSENKKWVNHLLKPVLDGEDGLPVFLTDKEDKYAFENGTYFSKNGYAKDSSSDKNKDSGAAGTLRSGFGLWLSLAAVFMFVEGLDVPAGW